MKLNQMIGLLFLSDFVNIICTASSNVPKIAVIGAGIGGASTTHFLKSLFGVSGASVDVFEKGKIGGRLALVKIGKEEYESGGSIIHDKNKYMRDFMKMLALRKRESPKDRYGLFDGTKYVFEEKKWAVLTYIDLFMRYGFDLFKVDSMIHDLLKDFSKIYNLQDQGYTYSSVENLLSAMNPQFVNMTKFTSLSHLKEKQISDKFINEIFAAVVRTNYGQTSDVNSFVGAVALAGMGSSLWSVNGGNKLVPELLLKDSKAKVIPASVTSIRLKDDQFVVRYNSTAGHHLSSDVTEVENDVENNVQVEDIYDIVIVATPLIQDVTNIRFEGFPRPIHNFKGKYHRTVCTIVSGEINRSYFKLPPGLDCSLTTTTDTDYNSLSLLYPANCTTSKLTSNVWNLFSQVPLSEEKIGRMFNKVYEKHVTDWLAYPHYTPPENLGPFILHPGLYYVNSIEWAASAMEMSAIGGRNAALLAYKYWYGINGKHDSVSLI